MNKKRRVSVIGNGITAEILSCMLSDEFTVTKHCDFLPTSNDIVPFYSNDIKTGIMGEFLKIINKNIEYSSESNDIAIKLFTEGYSFEFDCSFSGLRKSLLGKYSDDKESTNSCFEFLH